MCEGEGIMSRRMNEALLQLKALESGEVPSAAHFVTHVCLVETRQLSANLSDGLGGMCELCVCSHMLNIIVAAMAVRLPDKTAAYMRATADIIDAVAADPEAAVAGLQELRVELRQKVCEAYAQGRFYGEATDEQKRGMT